MGKVDIKKLKSQLTLPMYEQILKEVGGNMGKFIDLTGKRFGNWLVIEK